MTKEDNFLRSDQRFLSKIHFSFESYSRALVGRHRITLLPATFRRQFQQKGPRAARKIRRCGTRSSEGSLFHLRRSGVGWDLWLRSRLKEEWNIRERSELDSKSRSTLHDHVRWHRPHSLPSLTFAFILKQSAQRSGASHSRLCGSLHQWP